MAKYICPVCGKNCDNLNALNACVGQHIQNEKQEKEMRVKEALEKKKKTIIKKGEELLEIVKEYNAISENPMQAIYNPPSFISKSERSKKDANVNKKESNLMAEINLEKMLNDINEKIKNSDIKNTNKEDLQLNRDLDACLDTLLGSLFYNIIDKN